MKRGSYEICCGWIGKKRATGWMCTSHIERYLIIEKTFGSTAVCRGRCRPNVAGGGGHLF